MSHDFSRRDFVKSSAALAAAPVLLRAQSANSKVAIGWIGTGSRGDYLMQRMYVDNKNVACVVASATPTPEISPEPKIVSSFSAATPRKPTPITRNC